MRNKMDLHELFACVEETSASSCSKESVERIKAKVSAQLPKQIVSTSMRAGKTVRKKIGVLVIAAAIAFTTIVTVAAAGHMLGLRPFTFQEKRELALPSYAVFSQDAQKTVPSNSTQRIFGASAQILNGAYLKQKMPSFMFTTIGTWETVEQPTQHSIPAFVFNNGDIAVFTKKTAQGWTLKKGDTLTLLYDQNVLDNPWADATGDHIAIGIISDGVPQVLTTEKGKTAQFEYTANQDGTFYFFVQNASSASIVIDQGSISQSN